MEIKTNATGTERKRLVGEISCQQNAPTHYNGAPTFAYQVGEYAIDKQGTVTGPDSPDLMNALRDTGFDCEVSMDEETATTEWRTYQAELSDPNSPDRLTIEYPLSGFTPETLDNLTKMVTAKEALIKAALGAEDLPIQQTDEDGGKLRFPWFTLSDTGDAAYYVQFVYALCKTAKTKKRVTAKPAATDNEKFSLRVWLTSLGMTGGEFKNARKVLLRNLSGNSSFASAESKERWDAKHLNRTEVAVNE
jgi:hypothetical protein